MKLCLISFLIVTCTYGQTAEEFYKRGEEIYTHSKILDRYQYSKAIEEFTKAIEKDDKYLKAYRYRGLIKSMLADFKGAIKDFSKILEIEPNNLEAHELRADTYRKKHQYKDALKDYNKAIILANDNHNDLQRLYFNRANTKYLLKMIDEACEDYSKSGELGSSAAYEMILKYCN